MSPVIVSIGAFEIRWYSVLMLVAIFIGLFLIKKEAQRLNLKYDFIFNTVPAPVLTKERLQGVKPEVCIIDIASRPGGTDFSYCQESSIFAKLCLGLPGIYAPKSSAGILMEVIKKTILGD